MIVVDSSALLAILLEETDGSQFHEFLSTVDRCVISAVNVHESITVLRFRRGEASLATLWTLIEELNIGIAVFDEVQVRAAADAFRLFGKGIHSKARLNLCDCAAYALAKTMKARLLFKGDDFSHTDLMSAV